MAGFYRCPECRTRRKEWLDLKAHEEKHGHGVCNCGGYLFPHRPHSPHCHMNPWSVLQDAIRAEEPASILLDIAATVAFENPGQKSGTACPF